MDSKTMRAIQVRDYGEAEVMKIEKIAVPPVAAGFVLVKVAAAGVNPIDWKLRSGAYKAFMPLTFPWTPGIDFAGTVEAVGDAAGGFSVGQKVFGLAIGSYAEYALVKSSDLAPVPKGMPFDQASTLGVGGLTAWEGIRDLDLKPGQKLLIHGAAGGVGYFAIQIARSLGVEIYATASAANADFVKSLGASHVIDYSSTAFESQLSGLDAVLDTVGGETTIRSYGVLRKGGIITSVAGGHDEAKASELGIVAKRSSRAPGSDLKHLVDFVEAGKLKALVGQSFTLDNAAAAHRASETRHGRGRIVIAI